MKWTPGGNSSDLEDRRDEGGGGGGGGGGGMLSGGRLGLGGTAAVLILSVVFRRNFFSLLGGGDSDPGGQPSPVTHTVPRQHSPEEDKLVQFVSFVIDDVQKTWEHDMPQGHPYHHAKLVLFTDRVRSGCGFAESAMGPFYCPADEKVYIDLGFYRELKTKFGAPGEFAEAYVIAHEVGHHVQNLLGIDRQMRQAQGEHPNQANPLSVKLELQADCLAGVWGFEAQKRNILDPGDLEDGLRAASAVGDDRLQKAATGAVHPETWTHGSSAQRMMWFKRGFESGRVSECDTFRAQQ